MIPRPLKLRVGDWVEVRPYQEILSTLDAEGRLDGLPFMPEMVPFCERRFRVHGRADRTCVETLKQRGMDDTVWLEEVRCDGSAHDGCQISCLTFWKEAWLKRAEPEVSSAAPPLPAAPAAFPFPVKDPQNGRYLCQSSQMAAATYLLGVWGNVRTYAKDLLYAK